MSRRLYRSEEDKMLAGVCSGIAKSVQVDPLLIRLAFVVLAISELYLGLVAYAIAAIVMPVRGKDQAEEVEVVQHPHAGDAASSRRTLAFVLIGLGGGLLVFRWLTQVAFFSRYLSVIRVSLWPLALIILGVLILSRQRS